MITRDNYEEYFLLYADNELSVADKKAVEDFVRQNPDVRSELILLEGARLTPDSSALFTNKEQLYSQEENTSLINHTNYEALFLLYVDKQLDSASMSAVDKYTYENEARHKELEILLATVLQPDLSVVFENKDLLFKREKSRKLILLPWLSAAAVIMALIVSGYLLLKPNQPTIKTGPKQIAVNLNNADSSNSLVSQHTDHKKSIPVVTSATPDSLNIAVHRNSQQKTELLNTVDAKRSFGKKPAEKHIQQEVVDEDNMVAAVPVKPDRVTNEPLQKPAIVGKDLSGLNAVVMTRVTSPGEIDQSQDKEDAGNDEVYNNSDESFAIATRSPKKNKLRGVFRRVSRVFGAASADDDDSNKRGILVGSFQIALK